MIHSQHMINTFSLVKMIRIKIESNLAVALNLKVKNINLFNLKNQDCQH